MRLRPIGVALALLCAAAPARASDDLAEHPSDSAIVVRGTIDSLDSILDRLTDLNLRNRVIVASLRRGLDTVLGIDSSTPAGWKTLGVATSQPFSVSISVDAAELEARYELLMAGGNRPTSLGKASYWKLRVVIGSSDPKTLAAAITKRTGFVVAKKGHHSELAGARVFLAVRTEKRHVVVDFVRPAFGPHVPYPGAAEIGTLFAAPKSGVSFARARKSAATRELGERGIVVWADSNAIARIGRASAREDDVDRQIRLADRAPTLIHDDCKSIGLAGVFDDGSIRIDATPMGLAATVVLGASAKMLSAAFPRHDHGLDLHHAPTAVWVASWLSSLSGLRALQRGRVMASWPRMLRLLRQCPDTDSLTAKLFAWPLMVGLFADELAAIGPRGKLTVESFQGMVAGAKTWHRDPLQIVGAIEGPLVAAAAAPARDLFRKVFGAGRDSTQRTDWGIGRLRPFIVRTQKAKKRIGLSMGGVAGKAWLAKLIRSTPPSWLKGDEIAAFALSAEGIKGVAKTESALDVVVGAAHLRGRVFLRAEQLVLDVSIKRK